MNVMNSSVRKKSVVTLAALAACAGTAFANPPQLVKSNLIPTRIVPTSIAPVYIIDGVEVVGSEIPYSDIRPAYLGHRVIFDQYEGDDSLGDFYPPIDHGGPCGGAGFLYTANTDSNSSDYFHVRIVKSVDDYKGMDPFGIGKNVTGVALLWMHNTNTEGIRFLVRVSNNFNEAGTIGTPQSSGSFHANVQVTFNNSAAMPAGLYYSLVDWTGAIVQTPLVDTDGAVTFQFTNPINNSLASKDQPAFWGTRTDELPFPSSDPRPGGQQNPIWYINDNGALATVPYNLANAIDNPFSATDIYYTGPNTDPVDCFRSTGTCWAMFVQECLAVDIATLNSPPNRATGVQNNFPNGPTFNFSAGPTVPEEFICRIKKNGVVLYSKSGFTATTFNLNLPLQGGQHFAWTITSSSGQSCPSTETEPFTFQVAGCAADYNDDDTVDFFDYLDFVDDFSQSTNLADFNADQTIDFFDYLDFVDAFAAGC